MARLGLWQLLEVKDPTGSQRRMSKLKLGMRSLVADERE